MTSITITGVNYHFGKEAFKVGQTLYLKKEEDNEYDDEAICVVSESGIKLGYVANSIHTVARGCKSAGYIHHMVDENTKVEVMFIVQDTVLAKIMEEDAIKF